MKKDQQAQSDLEQLHTIYDELKTEFRNVAISKEKYQLDEADAANINAKLWFSTEPELKFINAGASACSEITHSLKNERNNSSNLLFDVKNSGHTREQVETNYKLVNTKSNESVLNSNPAFRRQESVKRISVRSNASLERPILNLYPRKSITVESRSGINTSMVNCNAIASITTSGANLMRSTVSLRRSSTRKQIDSNEKNSSNQIVNVPDSTVVDYNEYLMLQNRHSSSNYIQFMNSSDLIWETKPLPVKIVGTYLKGAIIGKGAFSKVKEGLCINTLQRVAFKIITKRRVRKMIENIKM
jgi:hypothetical protein